MGVSRGFLRHQRSGIEAMAIAAGSAVKHRLHLGPRAAPGLPGPELTRVVAPRPEPLLRAYVEHLDGADWGDAVPAHLFPQWTFALATRCFAMAPFSLLGGLNAGCRLEVRGRIPRGVPLRVKARLERVDETPRRVVLETRVATGTDEVPEALVAHFAVFVPRSGPKSKERQEPALVSPDALRLRTEELRRSAARDFAKLTGDLNPIHVSPIAARAAGFSDVILHGFSTMARSYEALVSERLGGDPHALGLLDVRFSRPLVLPARVGVFASADEVFVGGEVGEPAFLVGRWARS